jgi:long-chain acyl-CoA synthetase
VARGYWNKPEATAQSFSDGWFHTGDIGKIDEEGYVYILDRIKDMIIRGGENVYCAEVEAALVEHPGVKAACVFGIPHQILGEEVAVVVEIRPDVSLHEKEVQSFLGSRLAKYKIPTRIWFRTEPFPVGATGKVLKKELKASYLELLKSS